MFTTGSVMVGIAILAFAAIFVIAFTKGGR
jgi:hypothetical protein